MKKREILTKLEGINNQIETLIDEIKLSGIDNINTNKRLTIHSSENIKHSLKTGRDEIWAAIPGFEKDYIVSNLGRVKRTSKSRGTKVGRILKSYLTGSIIYKIQDGRLVIYKDYRKPTICLCRGDGSYRQIRIHLLIAWAFADTIVVKENKIVPNTRDDIRNERTRMIVEQIDKMKPATLDNLRINYIPRGIRHWNHKLDNDLVELVRSNLDMTFKEFFETYGDVFPNVCLDTIKNVYKGSSWRVRTEPIAPMTNPEEDFPNGELYKLVNINKINREYNL